MIPFEHHVAVTWIWMRWAPADRVCLTMSAIASTIVAASPAAVDPNGPTSTMSPRSSNARLPHERAL
jgi:hypothetical protein